MTNDAEASAPIEAGSRIDVFEVYGARADASGWDFIVYRDLSDAMSVLETDMGDLEEGQEIRIIRKRYTQAQMDEVVYE